MPEFGALHALSEKLLKYSTPFGNIWVATTFLCRLIPLATIGDAAYGDEQDNFECVTTQPGCSQMCYNKFSPMSHIRFWAMQILILCFPSLIFSMIAANHNAKYKLLKAKVESAEKEESNGSVKSGYYASAQYVKDSKKFRRYKLKTRKVDEDCEDIVWAPGMRLWYVIHLFAKAVLEIIGFMTLYQLQLAMHHHEMEKGIWNIFWTIPFRYVCTFGQDEENFACSQDDKVPCWVSRPYEKQVFLVYMGIMSFVSIVICFLDFFYVVHKVSVKKLRRRKERQNLRNNGDDTELFPITE